MITFTNLGRYKCHECGKNVDNVYLVTFNPVGSTDDASICLCPDCRKTFISCLRGVTSKSELEDVHGGKWFQIWQEDRDSVLATMYKNMAADLDAGYDMQGKAIQDQIANIDAFRQKYREDLDRFVKMEDGEVSRWCYYDLKKRGAI